MKNAMMVMMTKAFWAGFVDGIRIAWNGTKMTFKTMPVFATVMLTLGLALTVGSILIGCYYSWWVGVLAYVVVGTILNLVNMFKGLNVRENPLLFC